MDNIVLFDGVCNFCDKSVQFIIKHDSKAVYKFASIQSEPGQKLIQRFGVPKDMDSMILVEKNTCYFKSSAALRIAKNLNGIWKVGYYFLIIPKPIRDFIYDRIAKNRYKWFGKKDVCTIPSLEIRKRFL